MFQESFFFVFKTTMNNVFFSNIFFCYHAPFIFKMGEDIILIIKKEKALKIGEIHSKTHLDAFASNVFFNFFNYEF